jgi:hypothetical protein
MHLLHFLLPNTNHNHGAAARRLSQPRRSPPTQPHCSPATLHLISPQTPPHRAPPPNPSGSPAGSQSRTTQLGLARLLLPPPAPSSTAGCAVQPHLLPSSPRAVDRPPRRPRDGRSSGWALPSPVNADLRHPRARGSCRMLAEEGPGREPRPAARRRRRRPPSRPAAPGLRPLRCARR